MRTFGNYLKNARKPFNNINPYTGQKLTDSKKERIVSVLNKLTKEEDLKDQPSDIIESLFQGALKADISIFESTPEAAAAQREEENIRLLQTYEQYNDEQ